MREGPEEATEEGRLWLNDGSCIRLRPEYEDHVWRYDCMMARNGIGTFGDAKRAVAALARISKYASFAGHR